MATVNYYIDYHDIKTVYGVHVSASKGVLDRPKLKTRDSTDWPDYHGSVVDLTGKRLQAREITLTCWIAATNEVDFMTKVNAFEAIFQADGTQRLMIEIAGANKPLVYEIYCTDGVTIDKTWRSADMTGTFTLKLTEPDPVKRVLSFTAASGSMQATITLTSTKILTIFWGDGSKTEDCAGTSQTYTHTYGTAGTYYIVVAGVIEDITEFASNGTVIWSRL